MTDDRPGTTTLRRRCARGFVVGFAHAALLILSFSPADLWPLVLIALAPITWLATIESRESRESSRGSKRIALAVAAGAIPWHAWQLAWIWDMTAVGAFPVAVYMSLYVGLQFWIGVTLARRSAISPAITGAIAAPALEVFRNYALGGFGWFFLAHPLINIGLVGSTLAPMIGATGTSLIVACIGASIGTLIAQPKRWIPPCVLVSIAASIIAVCAIVVPPVLTSDRSITVAIVQTNVEQDVKLGANAEELVREFNDLVRLLRAADKTNPDLIVVPETMSPSLTLDANEIEIERAAKLVFRITDSDGKPAAIRTTQFADELLALHASLRAPLLIGDEAFEGLQFVVDAKGRSEMKYTRRFNSAYLLAHGTVQARTDKIKPTPFGEEIPFISAIPALQPLVEFLGASGMKLDLSRGTRPTLFTVPTRSGDVSFVTPICFEVTYPVFFRRIATPAHLPTPRVRPDLLVSITNDGWFGVAERGREQHMQVAQWRCAEFGLPMARSSNTGISASIRADGSIAAVGIDGVRSKTSGVLLTTIPLAPPGIAPTAYATYGSWIDWGTLVTLGGLVVLAIFRRRTSEHSA